MGYPWCRDPLAPCLWDTYTIFMDPQQYREHMAREYPSRLEEREALAQAQEAHPAQPASKE